jgi:tetratricopeptide (TPR) repeat protein
MSRTARADVHRRVADWIETLPPDRADDRTEILAHHLLEAIDYSRAAGLDDRELVPRAALALRESGDRAWRIGALTATLGFYTRLRELDPTVDDDPYFLLAIGLALASGAFGDVGADELERAAAALEASDPSAAAQATITRGEYVWQRGDQESAFAYFDRARALVEGAPLSREKQYVLAQCARFLALAGRNDEALPLAEESIAMAEELGDDDMLGDALNNRAIVRSNIGHPGWLEDSERSIELLLRMNSFRVTRAYINFGSNLVDTAANLVRGEAATREGLAIGQRIGLPSTSIRWFVGNLAELTYLVGKWDEALALAEDVLAAEYHYQLAMAHGIRAAIGLARGDAEGAVSDADASLRDARAIRDPQALRPALVTSAEMAYRTGDAAAANGLLDELQIPEGTKGSWIVRAALLCRDLHRELAIPVDGEPRSAWSDAALAIVRGDLEPAADVLEPTGARTLEAAARLRAAIAQAGEGRRPSAEAQLGRALAFYREVGASAYVREAEALLPAAS